MNVKVLHKAFELLNSNPIHGKLKFFGQQEDELVEKAENALGLYFPTDYRIFLKKFGAGSIGSFEIYGLTTDNFFTSSVPNMVWCTLKDREIGLPDNLIRIGNNELGSPYLKISRNTELAPVISYNPGIPQNKQNCELLNSSFSEYFLQNIQKEISYLD